jgi:hypothetical protein
MRQFDGASHTPRARVPRYIHIDQQLQLLVSRWQNDFQDSDYTLYSSICWVLA